MIALRRARWDRAALRLESLANSDFNPTITRFWYLISGANQEIAFTEREHFDRGCLETGSNEEVTNDSRPSES
jgi:hypothetical protein